MTSPRKHAANRRNARHSTGPRSQRGKTRAALNAVTHGLSSRQVLDAKSQEEVEALARAFAGEDADHPPVLEHATQAAEAQILLACVKEARSRVWEEARRDSTITDRGKLFALTDPRGVWHSPKELADFVGDLKKVWPDHLKAPFESELELDVAVVELTAKRLSRLVRYERRAANMRDKALRELEEVRVGILNLDARS